MLFFIFDLKALIARQQWSDEGFYRAVNKDDPMIVKALDLFKTKDELINKSLIIK